MENDQQRKGSYIYYNVELLVDILKIYGSISITLNIILSLRKVNSDKKLLSYIEILWKELLFNVIKLNTKKINKYFGLSTWQYIANYQFLNVFLWVTAILAF